MSGGSFNLDTHEDAAQEGGAHAPPGEGKPEALDFGAHLACQVRNTVGTRQRRGASCVDFPSPKGLYFREFFALLKVQTVLIDPGPAPVWR